MSELSSESYQDFDSDDCEKVSNNVLSDGSINGIYPSTLNFNTENKRYSKKCKELTSLLSKKDVNLEKLKKMALTEGGFVNDELRRIAWPKLLGVSDVKMPPLPSEEELKLHPEYQQVVLDVNRSLKRFPPGIPLDQRLALQSQLTCLIMRVVMTYPRLCYYQGYHDVAVTFLLVTGEDAAFLILEKLSNDHLKDCMEPTMDKTSYLLNYIYPIVKYLNKKVYEHLEESGVGTMFALPWFLTWFGHSLNQYKDVVRLYDYFLASEKLAPLYLSAVIVAHRAEEVLESPCDMASLHSVLSQIPENLPFEKLLSKTTELYKEFPPEEAAKEVKLRTELEQQVRQKELALRQQRLNQSTSVLWRLLGRIDPRHRLPVWALGHARYIPLDLRRYRYVVATATFAVGLYAFYMKSVEAVHMDAIER